MDLPTAEFVLSNKNRKVLIFNNFEYILNKNVGESGYWVCRNKKSDACRAMAQTITIDGQQFVKKVQGEHHHSSRIIKRKVMNLEKEYVKNAANNPTIACRTVLGEICQNLQNDSLAAATSMSKQNTIKQRIYRARKKNLQEDKLPKTADDFLNMDDKYKTLDSGEKFLRYVDNLESGVMLMFMSDFGKHTLQKAKRWLCDGTHKAVPSNFSQLYVIFAEIEFGDEVKLFPCCYLLLPAKNSNVYDIVLDILIKEVGSSPESFGIDFEQAMVKSIRAKFADQVTVDGCYFHFKQAVFRNVGNKGCLPLFHENEQFQVGLDLIYQLCNLPTSPHIETRQLYIVSFPNEHIWLYVDLD